MKVSVLIFGTQRPQQLVPYGGAVKWGGASRLWFGQGTSFDSLQLASWLAGLGMSVPVGMGVSLMPLRAPQQAAIEARSLAAITGHDVIAGFGPGAARLQEGVLGDAYESPLGAMREFIEAVRVLLGTDEPGMIDLDRRRNYYPLPGANLPEIPAPRVDVGLGILRRGMAKLVGEVGDCGITWLLPAAHLGGEIRSAIQEGAAGRRPEPKVVAIVPAAVETPKRDPRSLALSALGGHLNEPQYRAALVSAGVPVTGSQIEDAALCAEYGVLMYGSPASLRDQLREYEEAGVDEVVLNLSGVAQTEGANAAAHDLRILLESLLTDRSDDQRKQSATAANTNIERSIVHA